jgi:hypothetical protein
VTNTFTINGTLLQFFALFLGLSVYGAMWKGAQDHGQLGWAVALIWAVALQLGLQATKQLRILLDHVH